MGALSAGSAAAQEEIPDSEGISPSSDIIVTGTRRSGISAADSAAPIDVVGAEELARAGSTGLSQAISRVAPSFVAQSFGGDTANLTLSARLRGLNPNQTLVLINGKRRHGTANLQVVSGALQGGAAPDLDLIPVEAIERIEVLQDGAAAQYGSDAIAGVINIILKSDRSGGELSAHAGSYYQGGGDTFAQSARLALPIAENGFVDLAVSHRFHDFSRQGGADIRVSRRDGTLLPGVPAAWASIPGYPNFNREVGDARSDLTTVFVNAGYDFGAVEAYGFGSWGRRTARSNQSYRLPDRVSRTVNGVTTLFAPNGFNPQIALNEIDYALTGGLRGTLSSGWKWDVSGTYGRDRERLYTRNSANASLYADTGFTPTDFYDGAFIASQLTANLDIAGPVDIGLAEPLTLAFGGEYRRDTYTIRQGEPESIYKEGPQGYPGFQPIDAGSHNRRAWSAYVDIAANPLPDWTIDLAGRYEHYSDFGGTTNGKFTTRYDFSPAFAVRGTVSTGFRAPTLAEKFYSAVAVSPSVAIVQLPADSQAAASLGFAALKPEKSTNYSAGLVLRPAAGLNLTLDAYQISVRNRIAATSVLLGRFGSFIIRQSVLDAIALHGNIIDPQVLIVATSAFANAVDTRTRGVEFAAAYTSDFDFGRVDWSLSANYNRTKITRGRIRESLLSKQIRGYLETASPRYKVVAGALLTSGPVTVSLRETLYGPTSTYLTPDAVDYYKSRIGVAAITDLEIAVRPVERLEIAVGANNLFNKRPPAYPLAADGSALISGGNVYDTPITDSPYGFNGGYYYGKVSLKF